MSLRARVSFGAFALVEDSCIIRRRTGKVLSILIDSARGSLLKVTIHPFSQMKVLRFVRKMGERAPGRESFGSKVERR